MTMADGPVPVADASTMRAYLAVALRRRDFFIPSTRRDRLRCHPAKTLLAAALSRMQRATGGRVRAEVRARAFWGDWLRVLLPEGSPLYYWGLIDGEELNLTCFLVDHLRAGDTVVDVGAHFGYYTLLASVMVGCTGSVHAFEPTPRTFEILRANAQGRRNVTVHQQALWRSKGTLVLVDFGPQAGAFNTLLRSDDHPHRVALGRHGWAATRLRVGATTLDAYCLERGLRPSFIKLDAEGAEYDVLLGALSVMRWRPGLSVEVWGAAERRGNVEQIIGLLRDFGYGPYRLHRGRLEPYRGETAFDFTNLIFMAA